MRILHLSAGAILLATPLTVAAQESHTTGDGIGFPTVEAALQALKARPGVKISVQNGWTIVDDRSDPAVWSFTPPGHPAHPAVVKRRAVERDGSVYLDMSALCFGQKATCDQLVAEFKELNAKVAESLKRGQQPGGQRWAPTEQQQALALNTATRFLAAIDEQRYPDAYKILTPGLQAKLSLDRFVSQEQEFSRLSGGGPARIETRVTWYNNPADAQAPGVYAALNIKCRYRHIDVCEEVLILHQQDGGGFLVMRQERNIVTKENERKIREQKDKRQGT